MALLLGCFIQSIYQGIFILIMLINVDFLNIYLKALIFELKNVIEILAKVRRDVKEYIRSGIN